MSNWLGYFIITLGIASGIVTIISGVMNIVDYIVNRALSKLALFISSLIITIIFFIIITSTNILSNESFRSDISSTNTTEQHTSNENTAYIAESTATPAPTATLAPTATIKEEIVYPNINMSYISKDNVSSSGYLVEQDGSPIYYDTNILDGDLYNVWFEADKNGFGYNEWVQIDFDEIYLVNGVKIYSGVHSNYEYLHRNNRIETIEIVFSDGTSFEKVLEDTDVGDYNKIDFTQDLGESVATKSIRFVIKSVYPADYPDATCWDDTGISEIILY